MRDLINYLKEHPEQEFVYFSEEGGWLFDKKVNHPHERHRDDVLALEDDLEEEEPRDITVHGAAELVEENVRLRDYISRLEGEVERLSADKIAGPKPKEEEVL